MQQNYTQKQTIVNGQKVNSTSKKADNLAK
jgi:hypothetical protein